jgi:hypothetical protein
VRPVVSDGSRLAVLIATIGGTFGLAALPVSAGATTFRPGPHHRSKIVRWPRSVDDRFTYQGKVDYTHIDSYQEPSGCSDATTGDPVYTNDQTFFQAEIKWKATFTIRGIPLNHAGKPQISKGIVTVTGSTWKYRGTVLDGSNSNCPPATTKWTCGGKVSAPRHSAVAVVTDVKDKQDHTKAANLELSPFEGAAFTPPQCRADNATPESVSDGGLYIAKGGDSFPLLTITSFGGDMLEHDLLHSGSIKIVPTDDLVAQNCTVADDPGFRNDSCTQAFSQSARLAAKVLKVHIH